MSTSSDNQAPQSADEFAQHLRARAEQAVAASVQHANLSERYLDLSSQLAALAEKASVSSTEDLQKAIKSIEAALAASTSTISVPAMGMSAVGQGTSPDVTVANTDTVEPPTSDSSVTEVLAAASPSTDNSDSATDAISPVSETKIPTPAPKRKRSRRLQARTFVERVRSAKLALTRRVRIKANKEDLKPQHRKALEELNRNRSSIASSLIVLMAALFILSLITLQLEIDIPVTPIMASFADEIAEIEEPLPVEMPEEETGEQQEEETEEPVEELVEATEPEEETEVEEPVTEPTSETADAPEAEVEIGEIPAADEGAEDTAAVNNRSESGRKQMLEKFGGSAASESAVQRGLEWLVSVQHPQGWWDFTQVGEAGDPGRVNNPIGATAYTLMPFLAAGQTHQDGRYRKQVKAGLDYLSRIGVRAPAGYDLRGVLNKGDDDKEPNEAYYVHGAATLVLCEAYGMTKDRRLRKPAEGALLFLLNSQDPRGGGWRYLPQQPGSTSVTAIQVMALMAAKKAGMKVPAKTLEGVMHYLDSVQVDGDGRYGYESQKKTYKGSVSAMALLCRMYLGWDRDDGDMRSGVALLDKAGPWDNLYTTYFATQVMRNWGGKEWARWNDRLRDELVATQVADGPGLGSWKPRTGMHTKQGGRLLETCLATLTLEVYYRYKPVLPDVDPAVQQVAAE